VAGFNLAYRAVSRARGMKRGRLVPMKMRTIIAFALLALSIVLLAIGVPSATVGCGGAAPVENDAAADAGTLQRRTIQVLQTRPTHRTRATPAPCPPHPMPA
jgi:hypothetical protein